MKFRMSVKLTEDERATLKTLADYHALDMTAVIVRGLDVLNIKRLDALAKLHPKVKRRKK